jgi:hypothetical protein
MIQDAPCIADPLYFNPPNPEGLGEAFLRNIWKSVHIDKFSYLCTFTGRHRVGKSLSACVFSDILDPTFMENFEERVCYTAEQFMTAVESLRKNKIIGGAIVMDEANIGMPSREWYMVSNKSVNYAVQAFGYMRPIVSMVTQDITFIDSQPRKLFHAFFEVNRNNNEYSVVLPFNIKFNKRTGKMYFVYPRFHGGYKGGRGTKITMNTLKMMKPPKWFIDRYDKHSQIMKDRLIEQMHDLIHSLKLKENTPTEDRLSEEEILAVLLEERDNPVYLTNRNTYRADVIARTFKIPHRWAKVIAVKANATLGAILDKETQEDVSEADKVENPI